MTEKISTKPYPRLVWRSFGGHGCSVKRLRLVGWKTRLQPCIWKADGTCRFLLVAFFLAATLAKSFTSDKKEPTLQHYGDGGCFLAYTPKNAQHSLKLFDKKLTKEHTNELKILSL